MTWTCAYIVYSGLNIMDTERASLLRASEGRLADSIGKGVRRRTYQGYIQTFPHPREESRNHSFACNCEGTILWCAPVAHSLPFVTSQIYKRDAYTVQSERERCSNGAHTPPSPLTRCAHRTRR